MHGQVGFSPQTAIHFKRMAAPQGMIRGVIIELPHTCDISGKSSITSKSISEDLKSQILLGWHASSPRPSHLKTTLWTASSPNSKSQIEPWLAARTQSFRTKFCLAGLSAALQCILTSTNLARWPANCQYLSHKVGCLYYSKNDQNVDDRISDSHSSIV